MTKVQESNPTGNQNAGLVPHGDNGYTYYNDGSLKSDANKEIDEILYDTFLDQPKQIILDNGSWIKHYYEGNGTLLKTEYSNGEVWEYVEGLIFKNTQLYQMAIPEGRAIYQNGNWVYEFEYQDHLGNTRVSFRANGNQLEKTAESHFDPWGLKLTGIGSVNGIPNRWELQGHEKEETFGLNRVNFGARTFNPTIGRFDRVDNYSEKYSSLSTYQYAANNGLNFVDVNGDSIQPIRAFGLEVNFTFAITKGSAALGFQAAGIPVGFEISDSNGEIDLIGIRNNQKSGSHLKTANGYLSPVTRTFASVDVGILGIGREQLKIGSNIVSDESYLGLNVVKRSHTKTSPSGTSFGIGAKAAFIYGLEFELNIKPEQTNSKSPNNTGYLKGFAPIDRSSKNNKSLQTQLSIIDRKKADRLKTFINSLKND